MRRTKNWLTFLPSQLLTFGRTAVHKEVPMIRVSDRTIKTVVYTIAAMVTWLLTTVYYLLSASH